MAGGEIVEVLKTALETEREGMALYEGAARNAADPLTRRMFASFVADETRHLALIQGFIDGGTFGEVGIDPAKRFTGEVRTIFSDALAGGGLDASGDDVAAIGRAAEFERRGIAFYREKAGRMDEEKARALCERLAIEEENHLRILENTLEYLESPGDWFMQEERWSFEGG